jgi:hypothetical protein
LETLTEADVTIPPHPFELVETSFSRPAVSHSHRTTGKKARRKRKGEAISIAFAHKKSIIDFVLRRHPLIW